MSTNLNTIVEKWERHSDEDNGSATRRSHLKTLWDKIQAIPKNERPNCIMFEEFAKVNGKPAILQLRADRFDNMPYESQWMEAARRLFA